MNKIFSLYKNAYSGLSPSTWWLCIVMLINRAGTMVMPFMTLYMTTSLGYSIAQAGFVMALFGCGAICGGFIGGKLTDKFGFYFVQLFTLIGGGIMFLILGQIKNYYGICICSFFLCMVNDAFRPANASAIAHYSKEENRTRSYSLNRLAINLGWAFGGALGGFIASKNYELLFWIDGFTNISAAFMLWFLLAPSKNKATKTTHNHEPVARNSSPYHDKPYIGFIILSTLFAYVFFQLFTTMPVYFKQHLHLTEFFIGIVMALNGVLIGLLEMVFVHNLEGKRKNLQFVAIGVFLFTFSFIVFNIIPGTYSLALISMFIGTFGEMLSLPFMNSFWISRCSLHNRGQYAGLYTIAWSTAQILGPVTGSLVAQHFGFTVLWWMIGIIGILTALGFRYLNSIVSKA